MFDYLYYRFYLLGKLVGNQDEPKSKAMYLFLVFQIINLFSLAMLAAKFGFIISGDIPLTIVAAFGIFIIILNYFIFYRRHDSIAVKYITESKKQRERGFVILATYILVTAIAVFLVLPSKK